MWVTTLSKNFQLTSLETTTADELVSTSGRASAISVFLTKMLTSASCRPCLDRVVAQRHNCEIHLVPFARVAAPRQ